MIENVNEKIKECKSPEDLLALAKSEGIELTDSQLEEVAGGGVWTQEKKKLFYCPYCGADTVSTYSADVDGESQIQWFTCNNCNRGFSKDEVIYK